MQDDVKKWAEEHRRRLGLTQAEIGKLLGVSQPQARNRLVGPGEFTLEEIAALEKRFGSRAPIREGDNAHNHWGAFKLVDEYNVHVSAGDGALVSDENIRGQWAFNIEYLRNELRLEGNQLAIVEVRGDSMEPTLSSGDRVLVNMSDRQVSQPGIFIIYDGDGTVIKRVEKVPGQDRLVLISDNALHSRYEIESGDIQIVGRVVWAAKRL